jgi:hypothetical protein
MNKFLQNRIERSLRHNVDILEGISKVLSLGEDSTKFIQREIDEAKEILCILNFKGMSKKRYHELSHDRSSKLSQCEIDIGWHFCEEWDGLLIHLLDPEADSCNCYEIKESKNAMKQMRR